MIVIGSILFSQQSVVLLAIDEWSIDLKNATRNYYRDEQMKNYTDTVQYEVR